MNAGDAVRAGGAPDLRSRRCPRPPMGLRPPRAVGEAAPRRPARRRRLRSFRSSARGRSPVVFIRGFSALPGLRVTAPASRPLHLHGRPRRCPRHAHPVRTHGPPRSSARRGLAPRGAALRSLPPSWLWLLAEGGGNKCTPPRGKVRAHGCQAFPSYY